jgi:hypothetical protein
MEYLLEHFEDWKGFYNEFTTETIRATNLNDPELPCSTHLPVIPTYRSAKKKIPHTKCQTSLAQCLAKIEVIYMEQIVSY